MGERSSLGPMKFAFEPTKQGVAILQPMNANTSSVCAPTRTQFLVGGSSRDNNIIAAMLIFSEIKDFQPHPAIS